MNDMYHEKRVNGTYHDVILQWDLCFHEKSEVQHCPFPWTEHYQDVIRGLRSDNTIEKG